MVAEMRTLFRLIHDQCFIGYMFGANLHQSLYRAREEVAIGLKEWWEWWKQR